jgi:hypothetical protein
MDYIGMYINDLDGIGVHLGIVFDQVGPDLLAFVVQVPQRLRFELGPILLISFGRNLWSKPDSVI